MLDVMIMYSINTGTSSFRLLDRPPTDALLAGLLTGCDLGPRRDVSTIALTLCSIFLRGNLRWPTLGRCCS